MAERKPTIADVAREAGVSKGLVSFALNDRPGVAPETKARILGIAAELGWSPSLAARSLSTRTSYALGLVIRRSADVIAADPFFPAFIAGVESVLSVEGRVLVLSVVPDEQEELRTYRSFAADGRVDGVFLTDLRQGDPRFALLRELGLPAVALGETPRADIDSTPCPSVTLDDTDGIRQAVRHLVDLGHTRVAHVAGDERMLHSRRRRDAFASELEAAGLDASRVVATDFSAASGAEATRALLAASDRPTAIVYANDPMAIAGMGVAHRLGLSVPEDLSVTGFDGTDIGQYVFPPLTTIASDPVEWGRTAARTLLSLIADGDAAGAELPAAALLVRESTAPPHTRVGDGAAHN